MRLWCNNQVIENLDVRRSQTVTMRSSDELIGLQGRAVATGVTMRKDHSNRSASQVFLGDFPRMY